MLQTGIAIAGVGNDVKRADAMMAEPEPVNQFEAPVAVMEAVFRQGARDGYGAIRFVSSERFSSVGIDPGGDDRWLGLQRAQDLSRTLAVSEGQCGHAVGSDDLRERRKVVGEAVPQTDEIRDGKSKARQQHRGGARQHENSDQLPADGRSRAHRFACSIPLPSMTVANRRSWAVKSEPSALAARRFTTMTGLSLRTCKPMATPPSTYPAATVMVLM